MVDEYTNEQKEIIDRINKSDDYYAILGVDENATQEEIKKAYKKLSVLVHPDKNKCPGATSAFQVLNNAHATLINEDTRRNYDKTRLNNRTGSNTTTNEEWGDWSFPSDPYPEKNTDYTTTDDEWRDCSFPSDSYKKENTYTTTNEEWRDWSFPFDPYTKKNTDSSNYGKYCLVSALVISISVLVVRYFFWYPRNIIKLSESDVSSYAKNSFSWSTPNYEGNSVFWMTVLNEGNFPSYLLISLQKHACFFLKKYWRRIFRIWNLHY